MASSAGSSALELLNPGLPVRGGVEASPEQQSRTQRPLGPCLAVGFSPLPLFPFSLTAMSPQTSLFPLRYAGGVANLMRSRMRSIPTVPLRVPSAANARLSGRHASPRFLTMGKAVSMGLLGAVRIHSYPSLPVCFGPAWPIAPSLAILVGMALRHDHHQPSSHPLSNHGFP